MKTISKAMAICAFAVALTVSGSAWADGYRHHRHDGGYYGSYVVLGYGIKHLGHHSYKKRHHSHYDGGKHRHYKKRHARKHRTKRHDRHGHGGYGYAGKGYAKHSYGCHPVSKVKWHHGRKARFGGTMCYDQYGNGYVVPGSRYLVGYLY